MPAFYLPLAGAYVVITAATATIWSILTWHIRLFIRIKIHGPWSWDDIHCTIATAFAILQSSLTIAQTGLGLGRHNEKVPQSVRERQELYAWVSTLFYVLALGFSMLSVCFLIERVTKRTNQVRISLSIAIFTAVWTFVSFVVVAFQCDLPSPWITWPRDGCIDIAQAWIGITVARCILELANIVAAVILLWSVRMPLKPKVIVLFAFSVRLLVIPPSLTRLKYIEEALVSTDWSYSRIKVVIITQLAMHVSVILATVPCIRPWLNAFESGGLHGPGDAARRESHRKTLMSPKSVPLLPIAMYPATSDHDIANMPGAVGHRQRVEAWPVEFFPGDVAANKTVTTVEHDPMAAGEVSRKRSLNSSESSKGIVRTRSFSVEFEELKEKSKQHPSTRTATARPRELSRATSHYPSLEFRDAGQLLKEAPKAKLKSRVGSVASI